MRSITYSNLSSITLVIPSLGPGGAERGAVLLANYLSACGLQINFITYDSDAADFYELSSSVNRIRLNFGKNRRLLIGRIAKFADRLAILRSAIRNCNSQLVISFLERTNELVIMATAGLRLIRFASFQNDLRHHKVDGQLGEFMRRVSYPFADSIVFLDEGQAKYASMNFKYWQTNAIPNAIPEIEIKGSNPFDPLRFTGKRYNIVGMGRLVHQKGFDILLNVFAKIASLYPDWGLILIGEGPNRKALEDQVERLGLRGMVYMPGLISDPFSILCKCDIFAFSSRYEGQGLALIEAMACGLPVVSFDCESGPRLVIQQSQNGLLVPPEDEIAMADALSNLMGDQERRQSMGLRAKKVAQSFKIDAIAKQWIILFEEERSRRRNLP
jgi:GalNAc-alpha-(1->4)-GalNAc-alpha-(1->3)-diNAcBac-PP-undecaprenol alpha-1,4-N-acetyl-D-galactosaminyltransferase